MPTHPAGRREFRPSPDTVSDEKDSGISSAETSPDDKPNVATLTSSFTPRQHDGMDHYLCRPGNNEEGADDEGVELGSPTADKKDVTVPEAEEKGRARESSILESYDVVENPDEDAKKTTMVGSEPIAIPCSQVRVRRHPSDEDTQPQSQPARPPQQPAENQGYATLTADDFKAPAVDRSKKPRSSQDIPVDPDAPPIDRSRKPSGPLHVSATIDGTPFIMPEVTAATRRYSRPMYYAVPPGSVTMVAVPAHALQQGAYSMPPTLNRSVSTPNHYHKEVSPSANYDYPPSRSNSSANYDYPPPARSANYDYPPTRGGAPRLQRSMSARTPQGYYGGTRTEGNYSYPPPPVPAELVGSSQPIPIGSRPGLIRRTSIESRSSIGSQSSRISHQSHNTSFSLDENDGGDYLFTSVQGDDETEENYEFMAAGVMAGGSAPTRPPKPSL